MTMFKLGMHTVHSTVTGTEGVFVCAGPNAHAIVWARMQPEPSYERNAMDRAALLPVECARLDRVESNVGPERGAVQQ